MLVAGYQILVVFAAAATATATSKVLTPLF